MKATRETWLPVVGWEGFYEVSDQGRIRSVDREVHGADGRTQRLRGRILAPNLVGKGYHAVSLRRNGERGRAYIHRLVMAAFVGPCPPGMEVCHLDRDPLNNARANLRYDTFSGNNMDKVRHGTSGRGEKNPRARLTAEQVREARARGAAGESNRSIADSFGVHDETIGKALRRESWAWLD